MAPPAGAHDSKSIMDDQFVPCILLFYRNTDIWHSRLTLYNLSSYIIAGALGYLGEYMSLFQSSVPANLEILGSISRPVSDKNLRIQTYIKITQKYDFIWKKISLTQNVHSTTILIFF